MSSLQFPESKTGFAVEAKKSEDVNIGNCATNYPSSSDQNLEKLIEKADRLTQQIFSNLPNPTRDLTGSFEQLKTQLALCTQAGTKRRASEVEAQYTEQKQILQNIADMKADLQAQLDQLKDELSEESSEEESSEPAPKSARHSS